MNHREILKTLFTVPAVAGLMYVAGCDNADEPDPLTDGTMEDPGMGADPAMDPMGADPMGADPMGAETAAGQLEEAGQGVPDAVKEKVEEPLSNLEDALDSAGETTTEGAAGSSAITQAKQAVEGLRTAMEEGGMADVSRYITQLQSMKAQLPANVQQMIDRVAAAVPGVSSIPGIGTGGTTPPEGAGTGGAPAGDN